MRSTSLATQPHSGDHQVTSIMLRSRCVYSWFLICAHSWVDRFSLTSSTLTVISPVALSAGFATSAISTISLYSWTPPPPLSVCVSKLSVPSTFKLPAPSKLKAEVPDAGIAETMVNLLSVNVPAVSGSQAESPVHENLLTRVPVAEFSLTLYDVPAKSAAVGASLTSLTLTVNVCVSLRDGEPASLMVTTTE